MEINIQEQQTDARLVGKRMQMENLHTSKIEKLKNILIVVLVITTILLLYFLWGNRSLDSFIFNEPPEPHTVLSTENVLVPNQIVLCRGNEDYTVAALRKEDLWNDQIRGTFKNFSQGSNILVEEITAEQYETAMKYQSITAKFQYSIPFVEFCEKYEIKVSQGYENISAMTQLGFSKGSEESAFIFDGSKKKYYRLVGSHKLSVFEQVDKLVEEQGFITYYTLKSFLGKESTNDTLIPLEVPMAIGTIDYEKDTEMNQTDIIESMAQAYFGDTFDFVQKVEEVSGTTIYMYGYGQKVLIVNPNDGSIEYKEETKYVTYEQVTMFEALDTALAFVGSHGGFETISGQQIKPYIERVSQIDDKKNSYRFEMSFMVGNNKLFYEENQPIIIEVTGGQVSYFRREFVNFDLVEAEKTDNNQEQIAAINILANNNEYLRTVLTDKGVISKETAAAISFEDMANKIENLYMGYLKPMPKTKEGETPIDDTGELIPVWVVEVKGILLYFDLYDGEPKGYSVDS